MHNPAWSLWFEESSMPSYQQEASWLSLNMLVVFENQQRQLAVKSHTSCGGPQPSRQLWML
eukprot:scaffold20124_cov20-Tisochrysis_lutea.AAC.4